MGDSEADEKRYGPLDSDIERRTNNKKKPRAKRLASEAQSHNAKIRRMLRSGKDVG